MMISAISYNPQITQTTLIDPAIKAQLDALGLQSTGSATKDLAAIQAALAAQTQAANSTQSQNTDDANKVSTLMATSAGQGTQTCAWSSLMQELGLTATGNQDADFETISAKITELKTQATSEAEKTNVANLTAEFQALGGTISTDNQQQQQVKQPDPKDNYAGQNQLSELNKFFLINRR